MQRYTKLTAKGLYKDNKSGNYYCQKRISGVLHTNTFENILEAKSWLKEFHPDKQDFKVEAKEFRHLNGSTNFTFLEMWNEYKKETYPNLEISTLDSRERRMENFVSGLKHLKMKNLNPDIIDQLIDRLKAKYFEKPNGKRKNFDYEINTFTCFFAWFIREKDFYFKSPLISRRHKSRGVIEKTISREKPRMRIEHVQRFLDAMKILNEENGLYYDFALIQFLTASRAQDIAGLSRHQLDFEFHEIIFSQAIAWVRNKEISDYIKCQKNGHPRMCYMTQDMKAIILKYFNNPAKARKKEEQLLFHVGNKPIKYDHIRRAYERGLKRAKIDHIYTGTHIMRRAMAKVTRETFNSMDHVQAITGHKDVRIAEHYSGQNTSLQKEVVGAIEQRLKLVQ